MVLEVCRQRYVAVMRMFFFVDTMALAGTLVIFLSVVEAISSGHA